MRSEDKLLCSQRTQMNPLRHTPLILYLDHQVNRLMFTIEQRGPLLTQSLKDTMVNNQCFLTGSIECLLHIYIYLIYLYKPDMIKRKIFQTLIPYVYFVAHPIPLPYPDSHTPILLPTIPLPHFLYCQSPYPNRRFPYQKIGWIFGPE